jgi:small subunit ribosomal protein S7
VVTQLVNKVLQHGKRSTAEQIVYHALSEIERKTSGDPVPTLKRAVENVRPALEVKSRRVGGATYQVPMEVQPARQLALAMRWLVGFAAKRKGISLRDALANELKDAASGQGNAIKKRDDTHKMAQANRAFAHFRF